MHFALLNPRLIVGPLRIGPSFKLNAIFRVQCISTGKNLFQFSAFAEVYVILAQPWGIKPTDIDSPLSLKLGPILSGPTMSFGFLSLRLFLKVASNHPTISRIMTIAGPKMIGMI